MGNLWRELTFEGKRAHRVYIQEDSMRNHKRKRKKFKRVINLILLHIKIRLKERKND